MKALQKMSGHTRLYRRGAVYYHRAAIPKDISESYPKAEETFSLRTKDHNEALRLVRLAAVEVDERFDAHRRRISIQNAPALPELSAAQLQDIKRTYFTHLLDEDEEVRLDGFEESEDTEQGQVLVDPLHPNPRSTFEEYNDLNNDLGQHTRGLLARGKQDHFFRDEAEEVLTWDGIDINLAETSPSWPRLVRVLQEASVEAAGVRQRRSVGDVVETPLQPVTEPLSPSTPLLSEALAVWVAEKTRTAWQPKAANDYQTWTSHFLDVVGDRPLAEYQKADARAFKDIVFKLPANWTKKKGIRHLKLREAATKADQLGLEPMAISNMNKAIARVGAFWNWAEGNYDHVPPNLFKGLKVKAVTNARDDRNSFAVEQLQILFNSPLYTGCKSESRTTQSGPHQMNGTARYWLPLLSLFTGARLNELGQLTPSDVREADGIHYLSVNIDGEGKRLKTFNARREIPLHRTLIDLGFLELANDRREAQSDRVFPELKADKYGYYSHGFSKFFSQYLENVGAKTAKTSFHSLRHTFEDACRAAAIPRDEMDTLQGHSVGGMAARYGQGYKLLQLAEGIARIEYAGLSFDQLTPYGN